MGIEIASGKRVMKRGVENLSAAGKVRLINKYLKLRYKERAGKLKIFRLRKLRAYVVTVAGLEKDAVEFFAENGVYDEYLGKSKEEAFDRWYAYAWKYHEKIRISEYQQFVSLEEMLLWLGVYGS